ncbi:MAG TPA: IS30 family transposase [Acidobacteriaceae bacterium]|jgi:IS30 family transposase|nr:IS30 family transposase [Acidobacteriaceae bacterium]
MAAAYKHLSGEQRDTIARLHEDGQSCRQIAAALGCAASTVARELKRNRLKDGYSSRHADDLAWARRWRGSRLQRDAGLRVDVMQRLAGGSSPEQVSGRLAREQGRKVLSPESIYRFIDAEARRTQNKLWRQLLPRGKYKRGYRSPAADRAPMRLIPQRTPLSERPPEVRSRHIPGHWEADLMLFSDPKSVLLVAQERTTRLLVIARKNSKAAAPIAEQLMALFAGLPDWFRKSLTIDNGAEFSHHNRLIDELNMPTYFCDKHAPWQKGGIENAIGRLRRSLPRKTGAAQLSQNHLDRLAARYNQMPRKCLQYKSPVEAFAQLLLHFKCESTPSLRSG